MTTQQQKPLALDYAAHGAAKGWRANEHLIDALPYIDHVPPELKPHVDALIEEEKRRSTKLPSDYLRELPPVRAPQFDEHPVLKTEYERVRSKQPMAALDTVRYRLDPPPQSKRGDVNAWRSALENAHSQLEHQYLRILNQELLLKHGDRSWRAQVQLDEASVKSLEAQLAALRKETDALNRERKLQQHAAGAELSKLERQYLAQVRKNFEIERACDGLEAEVADGEERLAKRIRADAAAGAAAQQPEDATANGAEAEAGGGSSADGPAPADVSGSGGGDASAAAEGSAGAEVADVAGPPVAGADTEMAAADGEEEQKDSKADGEGAGGGGVGGPVANGGARGEAEAESNGHAA